MKSFVRALKFNTSFIEHGWGNGYVIIPKSHPLNGVHYNQIEELMPDLYVHGGLTFSDRASRLNWPEIPADTQPSDWIVGFDTAHFQDDIDRWPKAAVEAETERLKQQLMHYVKAT